MMLSAENLKEYCHTCLGKLDRTNAVGIKSIPIHNFPDVEHLIQICLSKDTVYSLCLYTPFLCPSCFDKWLEFFKLYQLAIETDAHIRQVLEKEVYKTKNDLQGKPNQDIDEYFINTQTIEEVNEIEKYETDSPFFTNDQIINWVDDKHDSVPTDDPTLPINSIKFNKKQNDDLDGSFSDKEDIDFKSVSNKKKPVTIKRSRKCTSKRKSFSVLKKTYKTRNTFNQVLTGNENGNFADLSDIETKRIRYQCKHCNKYFWEKNKYEGHMKQVHEGIKRPYKCLQCDKAYNLYKTLLQHRREYHSEKPQELFKCEKCEKTFKTGVILKQHLHNKHSDQKEATRSICDQCGFIAAHQYSLSRHIINKHTETDQIKCDQCPKVFKTQYSLKYHILGNHNPSNIKPFKCPECQMGFTRKTLLNQHRRTHLKYTERIKCDFEGCEVRFVKHGDKSHHMRLVHLKVKQHVCDFCGEAFGAMQTLRHHRFIHTGEKPYKCNVCGQGFRQRTAMKTHGKTHFGKDIERRDLISNLPEINLSLVNTLTS